MAPLLTHLAEHAAQLLGHVFHALWAHDFKLRARVLHLNFNFARVQFALAQLLAKHLARRTAFTRLTSAGGRQQGVQQALFRRVFCSGAHLAGVNLPLLLDGNFREIADDGVDILADITHFGKFRRLHLHKGRIGQPRQAPRDFRLADARRADHQNIFRRDFVAQIGRHLLAAPAVAQRNGDRALGVGLADDVAIEFGDDLLGGH